MPAADRRQAREFRAVWPVLGAAAAVIVGYWLLDSLSGGEAVAALAIVVTAALVAWSMAGRILRGDARDDVTSASSDIDALGAVIAALPQPAMLLDRNGRVAVMNRQAQGIAPALRIGEPATHALRVPEVIDALRRTLETGAPGRVEFVERIPAGRWLEAFLTPLGNGRPVSAGGAQMFLVVFHDLSPLRRVEEMRADFVANASHELRTPLAALSGFIETLKGPARNDTAARERFLGIMESQATRMARLIDDLLSLSRIELNAHLRPDKPVDLLPVIRQVVDALQTLAKDRGVDIAIVAPPEPLVVPGDRDELIRVFENLIENALKYGASGKRVDIVLQRNVPENGAGEAAVSVRDYGPGISAEHLPRLTERFYRVDVAGSRAQGGTGLGLALVKHILNRHRGRLVIESRAGEGATFTVRMPLIGNAPASG